MSVVDWVCKKITLESASKQLSAITISRQEVLPSKLHAYANVTTCCCQCVSLPSQICRLLGRHLNSLGTNLPKAKNKEWLEEEEEDCSFEILLTLTKEHRVKNKILGELNILSLSIS